MQANSVAMNSSQDTTSKTVRYDMFDEDQELAAEALMELKANCSKKGITREDLERLVHH